MAIDSKIEWTHHTQNIWHGCHKIAQGCKNCYAEKLSNRFNPGLWGVNSKRKPVKSWVSNLNKIARIAAQTGIRQRVFVGSMMDIFETNGMLTEPYMGFSTTGELREEFFKVATQDRYQNIIFLLLTKRPINALKYLYHFTPNMWLGASAATQEEFDENARIVSRLWENSFMSVEPQVSAINILPVCVNEESLQNSLKWIIQGGESGPKKRPFDTSWADDMRVSCELLDIPYFFKQIDKVQPIPEHMLVRQFPASFHDPITKP